MLITPVLLSIYRDMNGKNRNWTYISLFKNLNLMNRTNKSSIRHGMSYTLQEHICSLLQLNFLVKHFLARSAFHSFDTVNHLCYHHFFNFFIHRIRVVDNRRLIIERTQENSIKTQTLFYPFGWFKHIFKKIYNYCDTKYKNANHIWYNLKWNLR